jgi:hypothetical protein
MKESNTFTSLCRKFNAMISSMYGNNRKTTVFIINVKMTSVRHYLDLNISFAKTITELLKVVTIFQCHLA